MPTSPVVHPVRAPKRLAALILSLVLLSQAAFAAPDAARVAVVGLSERSEDLAFAYQNYYSGALTRLLPTSLASFISTKSAPPDVVRLEIFPKGVAKIREGQSLDL